jgi:hypothetical protein
VLRTSASSTAAGAAVVFNSSLIELARSRVRHYVYLHKLKRRFCGVSTIISTGPMGDRALSPDNFRSYRQYLMVCDWAITLVWPRYVMAFDSMKYRPTRSFESSHNNCLRGLNDHHHDGCRKSLRYCTLFQLKFRRVRPFFTAVPGRIGRFERAQSRD